jgi:hypothetical protein
MIWRNEFFFLGIAFLVILAIELLFNNDANVFYLSMSILWKLIIILFIKFIFHKISKK